MIVRQINIANRQDESLPSKNVIYFKLIIFFIIGLDIISGIFRFLGCIFIITLTKLLYKVQISISKFLKNSQ